MDYNKIVLMGRTGKDPEIFEKVTKFSLATAEKETTQWHTIICFGKTAELANSLIKKGQKLLIEGKLQYSHYEKDGVKKERAEIIAHNFILLDSKKADDDIPF